MKSKKQKKGILVAILILLTIFIPLSVFSFVMHVMGGNKLIEDVMESPNKEFFYQGRLFFYNEKKELIGTYECKNKTGVCGYATSKIDDVDYELDYYKGKIEPISLIRNQYAFLVDAETEKNATPFLYDVIAKRQVTKYQSVKNYGIGFENDLFIVGNDNNKYGVMSLKSAPIIAIKFEYDFIGVANFVQNDTNLLVTDFFVASKDGSWYLLNASGAVLTQAIDKEIVSYNGKNIIVKDTEGSSLVDYQNSMVLDTIHQKLSFTGKYLNILTHSNEFYVYDILKKELISTTVLVQSTDVITSKINESGKMEIILNEKVIETVAISS